MAVNEEKDEDLELEELRMELVGYVNEELTRFREQLMDLLAGLKNEIVKEAVKELSRKPENLERIINQKLDAATQRLQSWLDSMLQQQLNQIHQQQMQQLEVWIRQYQSQLEVIIKNKIATIIEEREGRRRSRRRAWILIGGVITAAITITAIVLEHPWTLILLLILILLWLRR
ncbi:hypothetical protein [Vulcanisaeta sp. JCM 14467]